jgi:molybdate transport system substrate-binding protein
MGAIMQSNDPSKPLIILAAGSLRNPFAGITAAFERQTGLRVQVEHGPAGLLREKIEHGAAFDIFASANMEHPQRLNDLGLAGPFVRFARNRLCLICRRDLGMTEDNMLDVMLRDGVKLGMSTPEVDPSGDYALRFFSMVNHLHPGKGDRLAAKAIALVGGRLPFEIPAGHTAAGWLMGQGLADVFISYASNGSQCLDDPNLRVVNLPNEIGPVAEYGVAVSAKACGSAALFQQYLLSAPSQQELQRHHFLL